MGTKKYFWKQPSGRVYARIKGKLHRITAAEGTKNLTASIGKF